MRAHNELAAASDLRQVEESSWEIAAQVLGHLADPTRLHLLGLLSTEQDVSTLTAHVPASRSSVSQHLGRLRLAGLVQVRRDGRRVLYRLTSDHLMALISEVLHYTDHTVQGIPHHQSR
jgi:DNA-binding transcriptional ArsR family regulator